jgi:hypothetical protein
MKQISVEEYLKKIGSNGGKKRAAGMTQQERTEAARRAAKAGVLKRRAKKLPAKSAGPQK